VGRGLGISLRAARRPRRRRRRPVRAAVLKRLIEERFELAGRELTLLRPPSADDLIDEEAFDEDEFLPYWAELWPAARALAEALPDVEGLRVVELGCGLGLPSLVAAAKGARVTATDWSPDAIELLRENAARNDLELRAEVRDWRERWDERWDERFDLALAADVLYERRNVEPVLERLRELAPAALVGLAGRPYEEAFLQAAGQPREIARRVVRLEA
jgi:predicted nicotinamide N-methyase